MSPRRRFQTDVPETEDPDGCHRDGGPRRMSPRRRTQTDVPETEVPDGCPRDGGSRRMSPRRRIQTEVSETDDQGGLAQRMSLKWKVKMGGPTILSFRLRDIHVCHLPWPYVSRRMSQTDVPETDDRDGGPRRMPQTDVPKTQRRR